MGQITEPTRSTREYLRAKAGTNARIRKYLKGISKKQKREAIARAASGTTPPLPVASTRGRL